jgi:hypothetical protein
MMGLFEADLLLDPNFVPCRDERCQRFRLHREHKRKHTYGSGRKPCVPQKDKDQTDA